MYGGGMQPRQRIRVTSAGGVVYRWDVDKPLFLLLASNKRGVWCLPKGLIEEGEDDRAGEVAGERKIRVLRPDLVQQRRSPQQRESNQ